MKKIKTIFTIIALLCSVVCFICAIIDNNSSAVLGWLVAILNGITIISYEFSGGGK